MPKAVSRREAIRRLREHVNKTGNIPTTRELSKYGLPSHKTYEKYFGSYNTALVELGYTPKNILYTDEQLLDILRDYMKQTGKIPFYDDFLDDSSLPDPKTYIRHFGSWTNALKLIGIKPNRQDHDYESDEVLKTFRKDKKGKISKRTLQSYLTYLADLSNFLKSKDKDWNDLTAEIMIEYIEYLKEHGCYSKYTRYARPNTPNAIYTKSRVFKAFLSWIEKYALRKKIKPIIEPSEIAEIKEVFKNRNVMGYPEETTRRALTKEEISVIRSVITNTVERNIFDLGLNLGLRVSEYERITLDMVLGTPDERRPRLNESEPLPRYEREHYIEVLGKGNKMRKVVVTDEMKLLIKKQLVLRKLNRVKHDRFFFSVGKKTKGRLQHYKINEIYGRLSKKAGVYFRSHELRYSMAELFQEYGVPQNIVSQRLGHSGGITQRYSRAKIIKRYKLIQEKVGVL